MARPSIPIAEIFSGVPHQLCQFHVIKELSKGVLKAVAQERARFSQSKPQLKRGRPAANDQEARRRARKSKGSTRKSVTCSRIATCLSNGA